MTTTRLQLNAGDKVGHWTLLRDYVYDKSAIKGRQTVLARCSCGTERKVNAYSLASGRSRSCGCHGGVHQNRASIVPGGRFGRLTVVGRSAKRSGGNILWECLCDCGSSAFATSVGLRKGYNKTCGCKIGSKLTRIERAVRARYYAAKDRSLKSGLPFDLDLDIVREIIASDCSYCGISPTMNGNDVEGKRERTLSGEYSTIDRIDNAAGYVSGNCVPACLRCNVAKNDMTHAEFLDWAKRLASHNGFDKSYTKDDNVLTPHQWGHTNLVATGQKDK